MVTGGPTRAERVMVSAFGAALPAHFRARQRAEWATDLADLAGEGRPDDRWRYLLAVGRTLPALRALANQAQVDGPLVAAPPAALATRMLAWVVAVGLGWSLVSWATVIAGPYAALLPDGAGWAPEPLRIALAVGGWAMIGMDLLLVAVVAVVTAAFVVAPRSQGWRDRLNALFRGVAMLVTVLALTVIDAAVSLVSNVTGVGPAAAGLAAGAMASGRFGLARRWRVAMGVLAVAGLAVVVIDNTVGAAMVIWFRD